MTLVSLRRLWTIVGAFLAAYTINAFLNDRGAKMAFKVALVDDRHVPNAFFSIIIIGLTLSVLTFIGRLHARQVQDVTGLARLPVVALDDVDPKTKIGSLYQLFFFVLFVLIPALSLLQFWGQLITHGRVFSAESVKAADPAVPGIELRSAEGIWQVLRLPLNSRRLCLVTSDDAYHFSASGKPGDPSSGSPCSATDMTGWSGGSDFLPIFSPLIVIVATAAGWVGVLMLAILLWPLRSLLRRYGVT